MANSSRGLGVGLFQCAEEAVGDGGEDMHMFGDGEEDQEGQKDYWHESTTRRCSQGTTPQLLQPLPQPPL